MPAPIPYGRQWIDDADVAAVVAAVVACLRGDWLTQGPAVERFELSLREATGAAHAVASGTAALHLAALAAGVGRAVRAMQGADHSGGIGRRWQGRDGDQDTRPRAAGLEARQGAVLKPPGDGGAGQAGEARVLGVGRFNAGHDKLHEEDRVESSSTPYRLSLASGVSEEWDRKNARRIERAPRKSRGQLTRDEESEFTVLQASVVAHFDRGSDGGRDIDARLDQVERKFGLAE